jgi:DNA-binding MarR family transcriptional regulator
MQIRYLHKNIYKLYSYAKKQECWDYYEKLYKESLELYEKCQEDDTCSELRKKLGVVSRATYFRRKKILSDIKRGISPPSKRPQKVNQPRYTKEQIDCILKLRHESPTYGKAKICVLLRQDHDINLSESTVGRILTKLKAQGLITRSPSALRTKRKRNFKGHAQPLKFKAYEEMEIGENVQIDHMTVTKNGFVCKHFQAWDRNSKFMHTQVYSNATSRSAARFLKEFMRNVPFKVLSIQVDGGSEFMQEFEETCEELEMPLYVLPPKRPDYNGGVERGNRTFREEFFARVDLLANNLTEMRVELEKALWKYNNYRPHFELKGLTPMEYLRKHGALKESQST